jgi:hypothetical protein
MIFVFLDDGTLDVVDEKFNFNGEYEGIDVENSEYRFFDECFRELKPEFETPNERGKFLFLLPWVRSGKYRLIPHGEPQKEEFLGLLKETDEVNKNQWFSTIEDIQRFVSGQNV